MTQVKKNDRVRIHCQGIVAEGPVRSAYSEFDSDTPAGIEMSDENSPALLHGVPTGKMGAYRYWKSGDGGHVYLLKDDGTWERVFPANS